MASGFLAGHFQVMKVILEIAVNREKEVAWFYMRRISTISPEVEKLLKIKKKPTNVVGFSSSGGRT